jgi:hypothetical protein
VRRSLSGLKRDVKIAKLGRQERRWKRETKKTKDHHYNDGPRKQTAQ